LIAEKVFGICGENNLAMDSIDLWKKFAVQFFNIRFFESSMGVYIHGNFDQNRLPWIFDPW